MANVFSKGWFVGIATGLISSLIVFFVARRFFSGASTKEVRQNIYLANREVIDTIRSSIPEEAIPTLYVISALRGASARRRGLNASMLHNTRELVEELVKEIMDSSFISAKTKESYCKLLEEVISNPEKSCSNDVGDDRKSLSYPNVSLNSFDRGSSVPRVTRLSFFLAGYTGLLLGIVAAFIMRTKVGADIFSLTFPLSAEVFPFFLIIGMSITAGLSFILMAFAFTKGYREAQTNINTDDDEAGKIPEKFDLQISSSKNNLKKEGETADNSIHRAIQ